MSQDQRNQLENIAVDGSGNTITFAPVQTTIETQILQISAREITQRELIKHSPYQGLKRFNTKDRDRFFGRDKLIQQLLNSINRNRLILVTGASGSGKSSVIRAGVIPELRKSLASEEFYDC
ncbi:ATP-binding protein [Geitlerinema sp. PCC 9228]|jgi:DNA-binding NtrC family response regulator|uniref:ATP-binding protein n=1 Tax=Geitlerinema sp. PCC 9228 TaxID=111611 RepID=UPI0008F984BC|nr:ATP-binding protein [Geitlerinema sp. PCC 9228]